MSPASARPRRSSSSCRCRSAWTSASVCCFSRFAFRCSVADDAPPAGDHEDGGGEEQRGAPRAARGSGARRGARKPLGRRRLRGGCDEDAGGRARRSRRFVVAVADGAAPLEVQERAHDVGRVDRARAGEEIPARRLDAERCAAEAPLAQARPGVADRHDPGFRRRVRRDRVAVGPRRPRRRRRAGPRRRRSAGSPRADATRAGPRPTRPGACGRRSSTSGAAIQRDVVQAAADRAAAASVGVEPEPLGDRAAHSPTLRLWPVRWRRRSTASAADSSSARPPGSPSMRTWLPPSSRTRSRAF